MVIRKMLKTGMRMLPRRAKDEISRMRRYQTADERVLPDFIIAGAQKGGTSSLYAYLTQHPQIIGAATKEVHFFDNRFELGTDWYRSHFPTMAELDGQADQVDGHVLTGEGSPYYLFHPHAPARIAEVVPQVRLIAMLRNPVERAYSHYRHMVRKNVEPLSFEEAIAKEEERLDGEVERMLADPTYLSYNHQHFSYRARGIYADQLEAYEKWFRSDQMLVLESERFYRSTQGVYDEVTDFLGLERWEPAHFEPRNAGSYTRRATPMEEELSEYYLPHNERLFDRLGASFSW
jgi:hypothetical protein